MKLAVSMLLSRVPRNVFTAQSSRRLAAFIFKMPQCTESYLAWFQSHNIIAEPRIVH